MGTPATVILLTLLLGCFELLDQLRRRRLAKRIGSAASPTPVIAAAPRPRLHRPGETLQAFEESLRAEFKAEVADGIRYLVEAARRFGRQSAWCVVSNTWDAPTAARHRLENEALALHQTLREWGSVFGFGMEIECSCAGCGRLLTAALTFAESRRSDLSQGSQGRSNALREAAVQLARETRDAMEVTA